MTQYVRALVPREGAYDLSTTTSAIHAASEGWALLDEPTHELDGRIRPDTRANGRPPLPPTSVAQAAAKKKAATSANNSDTTPSIKEK